MSLKSVLITCICVVLMAIVIVCLWGSGIFKPPVGGSDPEPALAPQYQTQSPLPETQKPQADAAKLKVNTTLIEYVGASFEELKREFGAVTGNEWLNGPIYRLGENKDYWFGFDGEYTQGNNGFAPGSENSLCIAVYASLDNLLLNMDKPTYTIKELEGALGVKFEKGYDQHDDLYYYVFEMLGRQIYIYDDGSGVLDTDTGIQINQIR